MKFCKTLTRHSCRSGGWILLKAQKSYAAPHFVLLASMTTDEISFWCSFRKSFPQMYFKHLNVFTGKIWFKYSHLYKSYDKSLRNSGSPLVNQQNKTKQTDKQTDGRIDGRTGKQTDRQTVWLLYAPSQGFGGIKIVEVRHLHILVVPSCSVCVIQYVFCLKIHNNF